MEPAVPAPRQGQQEPRVRVQPVALLEAQAQRVLEARQEPLAPLQPEVLPEQQAALGRRVLEALRVQPAQVVSEEAARAGQEEPHRLAPTAP